MWASLRLAGQVLQKTLPQGCGEQLRRTPGFGLWALASTCTDMLVFTQERDFCFNWEQMSWEKSRPSGERAKVLRAHSPQPDEQLHGSQGQFISPRHRQPQPCLVL